jgi:hypothetical protein
MLKAAMVGFLPVLLLVLLVHRKRMQRAVEQLHRLASLHVQKAICLLLDRLDSIRLHAVSKEQI